MNYSCVIEVPRYGLVHSQDKEPIHSPTNYEGYSLRVFISQTHLKKRVEILARDIVQNAESKGIRELHLAVIMKGAAVFADALAGMIHSSHGPALRLHPVHISSYAGGTESSGQAHINGGVPSLAGLNVLIVDDIIDTGLTISTLRRRLLDDKPDSLSVCALMDKPARRRRGLEKSARPDYSGFIIPDVFVAGYGLDYRELYRQLPYVAVICENMTT